MTAVQPPAPAEPRAVGIGPAQVELTPWEQVALITVAIGLTQDAAARKLGISPRTIRRVLTSATERLGARSQAHAVALAAVAGQLDLGAVERGVPPQWPEALGEGGPCAAARASHIARADERRARVAELLGEGLSVEVVAARVGLAPRTVRRHRRRSQAGSG